ncbi:phosphatase PAP2 family protein [Rhizobium sp. AG855]|uniref:phosphatase PAP2 family protein n=1 Tax=Rhizobium sp. AG855 TaxID=2183898 RepID=UPI000E753ABF|nr:phosphatase PAP2 family protein [Rhizobium sp. AG855]RKE84225.1 PAP2 superfamily protein [Rhizobium sp. AG855]
MSRDLANLRCALPIYTVCNVIAIVAITLLSKLRLDVASFGAVFFTVPLLVVGALFTRRRGMGTASLILEVLCSGIVLSVVVLLASYLAISLDRPLVDAALADADRWLGFNAFDIVTMVNNMPVLSSMLMYAYSSFSLQLLVLPILLIVLGSPASAYTLVLSYGLAGVVASLISIWFPAVGAHISYDLASQRLPSVNLYYGYAFLSEFNAVRANSEFTLSLATAQGILTFPSVHTAVAIICTVASFGQRVLRYPVLTLNVLMLISTVTHGGHYLVDVIAGIVVATLALVTTLVIARSRIPGIVALT